MRSPKKRRATAGLSSRMGSRTKGVSSLVLIAQKQKPPPPQKKKKKKKKKTTTHILLTRAR